MKATSRNSNLLSSRMVAMAFLFIFFVGSFGLATVGLRQQIATSAAQALAMERRLTELARFESRYTGEIAIAISPAYLEAQNERFQLGLVQPRENQVVRVDTETQVEFASRRWNQIVSVPQEDNFNFNPRDPN